MSCLFTNYNYDEVSSLVGVLELPPDNWMRSAIITDVSGNLYLPFKDYSEEDNLKIYRYKDNTSSVSYVSFCFNESNVLEEIRMDGLGSVYLNMCSPRSIYEGCKDSKGIVINPSSPDPGDKSAGLVVNMIADDDTLYVTLDKTWKEMYDAMAAGASVVMVNTTTMVGAWNVPTGAFLVTALPYYDDGGGGYTYDLMSANADIFGGGWTIASADAYPTIYVGE